MRAIAIDGFGGIEQLHLTDLPVPEPGSGEVLVRVEAAGVGLWDTMARRGLFGEQSFPFVPGFEVSGTVERVGESVSGVAEGDEVYGGRWSGGSYAEYMVLGEDGVAAKPPSVSHAEAAGLVVAAGTAYQALVEELDLQSGETVLVTAAAGGVGSCAVQIAHDRGARVIGTASRRNHEYLRGIGADEAVDYTEGDWVAAVQQLARGGVDAVLECAGGDTLARSLEAVRDGGRVAYIVPVEQEPAAPRGITLRTFGNVPAAGRLKVIADMVEAGRLRLELEKILPLERAAEAHERVEGRHTRGKIVLAVAP